MIGTNASGDSELEILGFGQTLGRQVARVESTAVCQLMYATSALALQAKKYGVYVRRRDDNFGIYQFLVEGRVIAFFVGGSDECVTLLLQPFAEAKLILSRS